jgi:hypothetical protein
MKGKKSASLVRFDCITTVVIRVFLQSHIATSGLDDEGEAFNKIWICVSGSGMHGTEQVVLRGTKRLFFTNGTITNTELFGRRAQQPYGLRTGLLLRSKRPAIYLKLQGRMFLITAKGIDTLRATSIFIKFHGRSKC